MQAEEIFTRVAEKAAQTDTRFISIADCQIRPTAISPILAKARIDSWISVLHHCPDAVRETRLLARRWTPSRFLRIANWAHVLLQEADKLGHLIVDTSCETTEQICSRILEKLESEYRN